MEKKQAYIIKIGGNIIDDEKRLHAFLELFASLDGPKILVHGGGKLATKLAADLGLPQTMVDGRRITDADTLRIVTMVYAGLINKNIVAALQAKQTNAIGLCGADANIIKAHKRVHPDHDFGYVGDVDEVNGKALSGWLEQKLSIVIAPLSHDGEGMLLNTNADTIAQEVAVAIAKDYKACLVYCFEKTGVLLDAADESTRIPVITPALYKQLKQENKIFAGMLPKLENAFHALERGVHKVVIGQAESLHMLATGETGTTITLQTIEDD